MLVKAPHYKLDTAQFEAQAFTVQYPVINKIDLAPNVGASLDTMACDARKMRAQRPFVFSNLKTGEGLIKSSVLSSAKACLHRFSTMAFYTAPGWGGQPFALPTPFY